jgi:hypothetical protein
VAGFLMVNLPRHRLRHMWTRVTTVLDVLHMSQPVYFAQLCVCVMTVRDVFVMTVNCPCFVVDISTVYSKIINSILVQAITINLLMYNIKSGMRSLIDFYCQ